MGYLQGKKEEVLLYDRVKDIKKYNDAGVERTFKYIELLNTFNMTQRLIKVMDIIQEVDAIHYQHVTKELAIACIADGKVEEKKTDVAIDINLTPNELLQKLRNEGKK